MRLLRGMFFWVSYYETIVFVMSPGIAPWDFLAPQPRSKHAQHRPCVLVPRFLFLVARRGNMVMVNCKSLIMGNFREPTPCRIGKHPPVIMMVNYAIRGKQVLRGVHGSVWGLLAMRGL